MNKSIVSFALAALNQMPLSYCIVKGDNSYHQDDPELNIIIFCPTEYWKKHRCLPDYNFSDQIDINALPRTFKWYVGTEETALCSKLSKDEIRRILSELGFVENVQIQEFLENECWD